MKVLSAYETIAFDCDGVVLDSNRVKTEAFRLAASTYGDANASALVEHHVRHGGVSRFKKFAWFIEEILKPQGVCASLDDLLASFATHVRSGLLDATVAPGLAELRRQTAKSRWLIVSGGAQSELREIFEAKNIASFFEGGIFGSPDDKLTIFNRENLGPGTLYLGDSRLDWEVADQTGADFCFVSDWTEVEGWRTFCEERDLSVVSRLEMLIERGRKLS